MLDTILEIGRSGCETQTKQIRTVSENIKNADNPDFIARKRHVTTENHSGTYYPHSRLLQETNYGSNYRELWARKSLASSKNVESEVFDQIQKAFGEPNANLNDTKNLQDHIFIRSLTDMRTVFDSINPDRMGDYGPGVADTMKRYFTQVEEVIDAVEAVQQRAKKNVQEEVDIVNGLLKDIYDFNEQMRLNKLNEDEVQEYDAARNAKLTELSNYLQFDSALNKDGRIFIYSPGGKKNLVGDFYAHLNYHQGTKNVSNSAADNYISIVYKNSNGVQYWEQDSFEHIMNYRNKVGSKNNAGGSLLTWLKVVNETTSEFVKEIVDYNNRLIDGLNKASNQNSSIGSQNVMYGETDGMSAKDSLNFRGEMSFVVTDHEQKIQETIKVNFDTGKLTRSKNNNESVDAAERFVDFTPNGFGSVEEFINAFNSVGSWVKAQFNHNKGQISFHAVSKSHGLNIVESQATPEIRIRYNTEEDSTLGKFAMGADRINLEFVLDGEEKIINFNIEIGMTGRDIADALNKNNKFHELGLFAEWEGNIADGDLIITNYDKDKSLSDGKLRNVKDPRRISIGTLANTPLDGNYTFKYTLEDDEVEKEITFTVSGGDDFIESFNLAAKTIPSRIKATKENDKIVFYNVDQDSTVEGAKLEFEDTPGNNPVVMEADLETFQVEKRMSQEVQIKPANPTEHIKRKYAVKLDNLTQDVLDKDTENQLIITINGTQETFDVSEEIADILNANQNFIDARLKAYYHNNSLYIEHDDEEVIFDIKLVGKAVNGEAPIILSGEPIYTRTKSLQLEKKGRGRSFSDYFGLNNLITKPVLDARPETVSGNEPTYFKGASLSLDLKTKIGAQNLSEINTFAKVSFTLKIGDETFNKSYTDVKSLGDLVRKLNKYFDTNKIGARARITDNEIIVDTHKTGNASASFSFEENGGVPKKLDMSEVEHYGALNGGEVVLELRDPLNKSIVAVTLNFNPETYAFKKNHPDCLAKKNIELNVSGEGYENLNQIIQGLNSSELGRYLRFSVDDYGKIQYSVKSDSGQYRLNLLSDSTKRGRTDKSFSSFYGLPNQVSADQLKGCSLRADIQKNHNLMSIYELETTAPGEKAFHSGSSGSEKYGDIFSSRSENGQYKGKDIVSHLNQIIEKVSKKSKMSFKEFKSFETQSNLQRDLIRKSLGVNNDEMLAELISRMKQYQASAKIIKTSIEMMDVLIKL